MTTHTWTLSDAHRRPAAPVSLPPRLLLGPGPSNAHPRVLQAMGLPTLSHLDPAFIPLMNDVQTLLRYAWQTDNAYTIAVSGTGTAAMEAAVANIVEPGDVVLVGVIGYFGERLVDMAGRYGADVRRIDKAWGEVFTADDIAAALKAHRPQVLMLVHAETSTGALQPLDGIGALCHEHDCLLLADSVTSLGAAPLLLDAWGVDVAYSCSQKGLSCPPGASPLTFSPRAVAKLEQRTHKVGSWYLDMTLLRNYWLGETRGYHHTMSSNMIYALREGLSLVAEEGLEARWARHLENAQRFWDGLAAIDLTCHVPDPAHRIPSLTTVRVPDGVDAGAVARRLLRDYNIEIAGGFSKLAGKVWRVGLMGFNSRPENVLLLLNALEKVLS
ncbi:MAG: alanine--glyoxylate aminotransferase family protein [Anaerolineales bacterium]|nr:alanine--glyoxylate aminotransferase family protein [Anaerolineales bacterium]